MELDVERVGGWIEPIAKRPEEIVDVFAERRSSLVLDWVDGEVTQVCARQEDGVAARFSGPAGDSLTFVSGTREADAREAVRSLQLALDKPPLPVKPARAAPAAAAPAFPDADRWIRRLGAFLSRIAPRHRLRWSLSETARQVIAARAGASSTGRRLLSIHGTLTAASRRGDEERPFSFHSPDGQTAADELRVALTRAAEPREAARPCDDGETDVVLAAGCAAVFFHEILSHPLEAGAESPLTGLQEARLAVPELDVRDDATRLDLFGGYEKDDEGVAPRVVRLLDAGRLADRLTDRAHAARGASNGHARRSGPADAPLARGSNILVAAGHTTREEMIRRLAGGLWIEDLEAGSIELASGEFRMRFPRARRIRRGRLADECGPGILAGETLSALKSIEAGLGHDVHVYRALGFCARAGQIVPVQGAAPDVLVRRLLARSLA